MVPQINGDQSISPPNSRGTKNVFAIKKNNFIADGSNLASPAGCLQYQSKMVDSNVVSDYEESRRFSPKVDQKSQHNLIHNLNKGKQSFSNWLKTEEDQEMGRISDLNASQ